MFLRDSHYYATLQFSINIMYFTFTKNINIKYPKMDTNDQRNQTKSDKSPLKCISYIYNLIIWLRTLMNLLKAAILSTAGKQKYSNAAYISIAISI